MRALFYALKIKLKKVGKKFGGMEKVLTFAVPYSDKAFKIIIKTILKMELTTSMLPNLVERITLGYENNSNPLKSIREDFKVETHFEYENSTNLFFMGCNSQKTIFDTIGLDPNRTIYVFLKTSTLEDEDETQIFEVTVFYRGFMCDNRGVQKLNNW
jgi:hypothetical protein